jgi:hypothetical protein
MAVLYWVRLSEHSDIFTEGYVGVTPNFAKRMREHRHRFKAIWDKIVMQTIVVADLAYCYDIEKKLRPNRNIGWNKARGGKNNNSMFGEENPNFNKLGEQAPNFIGWYITPKGVFSRAEDAAKEHGCNTSTIQRRCCGRTIGKRKLPPQNGYAFKQKGGVAS